MAGGGFLDRRAVVGRGATLSVAREHSRASAYEQTGRQGEVEAFDQGGRGGGW